MIKYSHIKALEDSKSDLSNKSPLEKFMNALISQNKNFKPEDVMEFSNIACRGIGILRKQGETNE